MVDFAYTVIKKFFTTTLNITPEVIIIPNLNYLHKLGNNSLESQSSHPKLSDENFPITFDF